MESDAKNPCCIRVKISDINKNLTLPLAGARNIVIISTLILTAVSDFYLYFTSSSNKPESALPRSESRGNSLYSG
jgi:hypothetical protein